MKYLEMIKYVYEEMLTAKSEMGMMKLKSRFYEIQRDYALGITEVFKSLLKSKSTEVKNQTLWFLSAAIMSNMGKWKLSNNLSASFKNKIWGISSDVFCFNLCFVLLELCKPFLKPGHSNLDKIDPTYLFSGLRLNLKGETPICTIKEE